MNWLYAILFLIIFWGIFGYLTKDKVREDKYVGGQYELRMLDRYKGIGMFTLVLYFFWLIILLIDFSEKAMRSVIVLALIFGIPSLMSVILYLNHKVIFDNNQLTVYNWYGRKRTIKWTEIQSAQYSSSGFIIIKSSYTKVRLNKDLNGINELIKLMGKKTKFKLDKIKYERLRS